MTAGRLIRRLLVVALVAAFVVVCLRLGWWQWQRFGLTGSAQNLGYTLQWPVFALFAVIMWWRLGKLEAKRRLTEASAETAPVETRETDDPAPRADRAGNEAAEVDDELAAYNRYLARLHAEESDRGN